MRAGGWSQVSWAGDKEKRVGLERRRSGGAGARWEVTPPKRRTRRSVPLFLPPHCSTSKKVFFQRLKKNFSSFSLLLLSPLSFLFTPPVSCSHTFSFLSVLLHSLDPRATCQSPFLALFTQEMREGEVEPSYLMPERRSKSKLILASGFLRPRKRRKIHERCARARWHFPVG